MCSDCSSKTIWRIKFPLCLHFNKKSSSGLISDRLLCPLISVVGTSVTGDDVGRTQGTGTSPLRLIPEKVNYLLISGPGRDFQECFSVSSKTVSFHDKMTGGNTWECKRTPGRIYIGTSPRTGTVPMDDSTRMCLSIINVRPRRSETSRTSQILSPLDKILFLMFWYLCFIPHVYL